jgi:hypothetical protein
MSLTNLEIKLEVTKRAYSLAATSMDAWMEEDDNSEESVGIYHEAKQNFKRKWDSLRSVTRKIYTRATIRAAVDRLEDASAEDLNEIIRSTLDCDEKFINERLKHILELERNPSITELTTEQIETLVKMAKHTPINFILPKNGVSSVPSKREEVSNSVESKSEGVSSILINQRKNNIIKHIDSEKCNKLSDRDDYIDWETRIRKISSIDPMFQGIIEQAIRQTDQVMDISSYDEIIVSNLLKNSVQRSILNQTDEHSKPSDQLRWIIKYFKPSQEDMEYHLQERIRQWVPRREEKRNTCISKLKRLYLNAHHHGVKINQKLMQVLVKNHYPNSQQKREGESVIQWLDALIEEANWSTVVRKGNSNTAGKTGSNNKKKKKHHNKSDNKSNERNRSDERNKHGENSKKAATQQNRQKNYNKSSERSKTLSTQPNKYKSYTCTINDYIDWNNPRGQSSQRTRKRKCALDTACGRHVTPPTSESSSSSAPLGQVEGFNGQTEPIIAIEKWGHHDALVVPNTERLASIPQLADSGYDAYFTRNKAYIFPRDEKLEKMIESKSNGPIGYRDNGLYMSTVEEISKLTPIYNAMSNRVRRVNVPIEKQMILHRAQGHPTNRDLRNWNNIRNTERIKEDCESCQRIPDRHGFRNQATRPVSTNTVHIVYSIDRKGPIDVDGTEQYLILMHSSASGHIVGRLVNNKKKTTTTVALNYSATKLRLIDQFHGLIRNDTTIVLKRDNEPSFNEFSRQARVVGLDPQATIPNEHQMNAYAEANIKVIMNTAAKLLQGVRPAGTEAAIYHAIHTINMMRDKRANRTVNNPHVRHSFRDFTIPLFAKVAGTVPRDDTQGIRSQTATRLRTVSGAYFGIDEDNGGFLVQLFDNDGNFLIRKCCRKITLIDADIHPHMREPFDIMNNLLTQGGLESESDSESMDDESDSDYIPAMSNFNITPRTNHHLQNNTETGSTALTQLRNSVEQGMKSMDQKVKKRVKFCLKNNEYYTITPEETTIIKHKQRGNEYRETMDGIIMNGIKFPAMKLKVPNMTAEERIEARRKEDDNLKNIIQWTHADNIEKDAVFIRGINVINNKKKKIRTVLNDRKQDRYVKKEDKTSPVITTQGYFVIEKIAVEYELEVELWDIPGAYTKGKLVGIPKYIILPKDSTLNKERPSKHHYAKLIGPLYGDQSGGKMWYDTIKAFMLINAFILLNKELDCCIFGHPESGIIIGLYVDDFIVACPKNNKSREFLEGFKEKLRDRFGLKVNKEANKFLGIERSSTKDGGMLLHQNEYIKELIEEYKNELKDMKKQDTLPNIDTEHLDEVGKICTKKYQKIIGALLWIAIKTRPDLLVIIQTLATRTHNATKRLYKKALEIIKYLEHESNLAISRGLLFKKGNTDDNRIHVYCDSAFAIDNNAVSTSGILIVYRDTPLLFKHKRQKFIVKSSTASELVALHDSTGLAYLMKDLLTEISRKMNYTNMIPDKIIVYHEDNMPTIHKALNYSAGKFESRTITIRLRGLQQLMQSDEALLEYINTKEQRADALTKCLRKVDYDLLGMHTIYRRDVDELSG